jgi:ATP-dependent RNA helicase DDX49/DBP8
LFSSTEKEIEMELFSNSNSKNSLKEESKGRKRTASVSSECKNEDSDSENVVENITSNDDNVTFASLGMCSWLLQSTQAMGFRRPTGIQAACISSILKGRDVMGCAETGSGKTAAFALPILQHLSEDPFGIFAIILTPTRELAIQICEQFTSLGAPMGARIESIIGGVNMTEQSLQLSRRPHIIVATPGRLRHHLTGADKPDLSRARYLVLDEADRLLSDGFSSELEVLLAEASHPKRQTLLFSATLSSSLRDLEKLAMKDTLRFDLTHTQRIPSQLKQELLFIPGRVKLAYLVAVLRNFLGLGESNPSGKKSDKDSEEFDLIADLTGKKSSKHQKLDKKKKGGKWSKSDAANGLEQLLRGGNGDRENSRKSAIIFVGSCQRCAEISTTLIELGIDCVALHSLLSQPKRLSSLQRFRDSSSRLLLATDVASRGLDIPTVELVINYDLPRVAVDYVHRVGRAARAGRDGRSLSLVTPNDLSLVQAVEEHTGMRIEPSEEVQENDVVAILNPVSKAMRVAQQRLLEHGFEDQVAVFKARKDEQRKTLRKKRKMGSSTTAEDEN